eukprot:jgi/Galph1/3722/GphlegSOOS_G2424.1
MTTAGFQYGSLLPDKRLTNLTSYRSFSINRRVEVVVGRKNERILRAKVEKPSSSPEQKETADSPILTEFSSSLVKVPKEKYNQTLSDIGTSTLVRTRILRFHLPPGLLQRDVLSILQEYGRRTCGETDCIRVNIVQVESITENDSKEQICQPNEQLFFTFEAFRSKEAMDSHEYLSHTVELRKFLHKYCVLEKNDQQLEVEQYIDCHSFFPFRNGWNLKKSYAPLRTPDPKDPWKQRKRALDLLAKDVGVQSISIRITRIVAKKSEYLFHLRKQLTRLARYFVSKKGVMRLDVMEEEELPKRFVILEAYESNDLANLGALQLEWEGKMNDDILPFCDVSRQTVWKGRNVFPDPEEWTLPRQESLTDAAGTSRFDVFQRMAFVFGVGALEKVSSYAKRFGRRVLIITGWNQSRIDPLLWELDAEVSQGNLQILPPISVPGMLSVVGFEDLVQNVRIRNPDVIIGMGGGSALDAAKALATFSHPDNICLNSFIQQLNAAEKRQQLVLDYHSEGPLVPLLLIPSRPTLGAEVSHACLFSFPGVHHACLVHFLYDENALLTDQNSVNAFQGKNTSQNMISLLDARLYVRGPHLVISSAGLACLVLCLESYLSRNTSPLLRAWSREGLLTVSACIEKSANDPSDIDCAEKVALASIMAGLVREGKGFGLTGTIALALSGQSAITFRDLVCRLAVAVISRYTSLLKLRGDSEMRQRWEQVAKLITGRDTATEDDLVSWFKQVVNMLNLPSWKDAELEGISSKHISQIVLSNLNPLELPVDVSEDDVDIIMQQVGM